MKAWLIKRYIAWVVMLGDDIGRLMSESEPDRTFWKYVVMVEDHWHYFVVRPFMVRFIATEEEIWEEICNER